VISDHYAVLVSDRNADVNSDQYSEWCYDQTAKNAGVISAIKLKKTLVWSVWPYCKSTELIRYQDTGVISDQ
jgi:hypothetical protein